jgi:hypothetical protein
MQQAGDAMQRLLFLLLALFLFVAFVRCLCWLRDRQLRRPRVASGPFRTPEEVAAWRAREIASEVAKHGVVRPPWVHAPGHDPWSITWRMGDDGYLSLWASWVSEHPRSEVAAVIRRYGAVPADWTPWAAAVACDLPPSVREVTNDPADDSILYLPFEDLCALLAAVGIEVSGEPRPPIARR